MLDFLSFKERFKDYSDLALIRALKDCHETLEIGKYTPDHEYGRKLWAEIDAIRDIQMSRRHR
jgi:hypothetical protein